MIRVGIVRYFSSDQGSPGTIFGPGIGGDRGFYETLELPWRDNQRSISCIAAGDYVVKIRLSPKYGAIYWVTDVAGRSWILIHSGNYAGRVDLGFRSHVEGCILLGMNHGSIQGQRAVLNSRRAVRGFYEETGGEDLLLSIRNLWED